MVSKEEQYGLLHDAAESQIDSRDSDVDIFTRASYYQKKSYRILTLSLVSVFLNLLTVAIIFILVLQNSKQQNAESAHQASQYANLEMDFPKPWVRSTEYSSSNLTDSDMYWGSLRADDGIVALDNEWAASQGLPPSSSPFPWDENKSIYLISAYHDIHCLSMLHLSLREYRDGRPQSHAFEHNNHCLDWLRNNIMCHADDTPLYSTASHVSENGIGQYRQCRDWSKLEDWVRGNSACYRYGDFKEEDQLDSQIGRFKYCADDSPYLEKVRDFYGKGDEWFPSHEKIVNFD